MQNRRTYYKSTKHLIVSDDQMLVELAQKRTPFRYIKRYWNSNYSGTFDVSLSCRWEYNQYRAWGRNRNGKMITFPLTANPTIEILEQTAQKVYDDTRE